MDNQRLLVSELGTFGHKNANLEILNFITCTLWDHNAKFLIMAYWSNSWMPNDGIMVGINETK